MIDYVGGNRIPCSIRNLPPQQSPCPSSVSFCASVNELHNSRSLVKHLWYCFIEYACSMVWNLTTGVCNRTGKLRERLARVASIYCQCTTAIVRDTVVPKWFAGDEDTDARACFLQYHMVLGDSTDMLRFCEAADIVDAAVQCRRNDTRVHEEAKREWRQVNRSFEMCQWIEYTIVIVNDVMIAFYGT